MNLPKEINDLLRWTVTFMFINMGLASICLYPILRKEACSQFIQDTFLTAGKFWLLIGCVMLVVSLLTSGIDLFVRLRQRQHLR